MFAFMSTAILAQIPVTFRVDMGVQVWKGNFNPASDIVVVRGSFQQDAGDPGGNWQGSMFQLTDPDGDTIYTVTANLPSDSAGKAYEFKFVKNSDGWEASPNRMFTLMGPSQTLPVYFFNDDQNYSVFTNTIEFTADISGILGVGAGGAFDPAQDSLLVMGLDWEGGQNVQGNRRLVQDPFNPGIFTTTLTVQKTADSTKWKFKAFPDSRFSNGGWETGEDRWYVYGPDGTTAQLPTIVPRIYPLSGPLANDVVVSFRVDMNHNPVNALNGQPIPVNNLQFVGQRGGADFLGSWSSGGNWTVSDTSTGNMKVLYDNGTNGDLTANDNIWTRTVTVPAGTNGGFFEYKYAAVYPGADTANGGSTPLDNEGGFGQNHGMFLRDSPTPLVFNDIFGNFSVSVERIEDVLPGTFELGQNYPNPFNPSTKIKYSVPAAGYVSLKVFNALGQLVGTVVDFEQASGVYEVNFNAYGLSSGMYFYTLSTGNYTMTKKMMLVK